MADLKSLIESFNLYNTVKNRLEDFQQEINKELEFAKICRDIFEELTEKLGVMVTKTEDITAGNHFSTYKSTRFSTKNSKKNILSI